MGGNACVVERALCWGLTKNITKKLIFLFLLHLLLTVETLLEREFLFRACGIEKINGDVEIFLGQEN